MPVTINDDDDDDDGDDDDDDYDDDDDVSWITKRSKLAFCIFCSNGQKRSQLYRTFL